MIQIEKENNEVFFAKNIPVTIGKEEINFLKHRITETQHKSIRLCMHSHLNALVQEMLILHSKETYIRPHKHPGKSVSYYIIEGNMDMILFDDQGQVVDVIPMGQYGSQRKFYYRCEEDFYYLPLLQSDFLLFHETIEGPFKKSGTVFAPWAAEGNDSVGVTRFQKELALKVNTYMALK